jgi:hypothetical protein
VRSGDSCAPWQRVRGLLGRDGLDFGRCPGWRPKRLPRALAAAMPAMIVAIMRPCGVDKSKAKPFMAMTDTRQVSSAFSVCRRSRVLRPQRESSVTSTARRLRTAGPTPLPCLARRARAGFFEWGLSSSGTETPIHGGCRLPDPFRPFGAGRCTREQPFNNFVQV